MRKGKPKSHYEVLNIGPKASGQEIRLAYELLKQTYKSRGQRLDGTIRKAYEVLGDPKLRREYDDEGAARPGLFRRPDGSSRLDSTSLLAAVLLLLLGVGAYLFGPGVMANFVEFETGQMLYWKNTGKPLGVVIDYEVAHSFPEIPSGPAYRIEPAQGPPMWYPAPDLNRHCKAR